MMQTYKYPEKSQWNELCLRPAIDKKNLDNEVQQIINDVKTIQDQALYYYTSKFDKIELKNMLVTNKEIETAKTRVSKELKESIYLAKNNIEKFHRSQIEKSFIAETSPGVECWRENRGIEKVGLYIPGGSAPLFSSILMLGIPAKLANCKEIILCTPPDFKGEIHPAILFTANLIGINKIYKIGGAQAIAAMAFGTETISKVYKIFGPGNQYVTRAKEMVQLEGVAIDMPAGPSEVLIIADETCNPEFIAADLLSQAEHGTDSQVILLTNKESVIQDSLKELKKQLEKLPRREIAFEALKKSKAIILNNIKECISFSNLYAPEHLIIASKNASEYISIIENAGSVFLGNYSCESAGDYASGTNHTLPTNGFAKNYSGVSVDSFVKKITFQKISKPGLKNIAYTIENMAEAENLFAHKNAVSIRLKS